jgi:hypothetical protein
MAKKTVAALFNNMAKVLVEDVWPVFVVIVLITSVVGTIAAPSVIWGFSAQMIALGLVWLIGGGFMVWVICGLVVCLYEFCKMILEG